MKGGSEGETHFEVSASRRGDDTLLARENAFPGALSPSLGSFPSE